MTENFRIAETNRLLSVLLNVSNLSSQDDDPKMLGEAILERLHELVNCDAALCYAIEGNRLINVAHLGPINDLHVRHSLTSPTFPFGQHFLAKRDKLLQSDITRNKALNDRLSLFLSGDALTFKSWLFLPMFVRGRIIGMLVVIGRKSDQFSEDDVAFCSAFAHQAAIEFLNAKLDLDARKRADEVRTILQVQQTVAKRVEPDAVLQLIADEAVKLTGAGCAAVFLKEGESWSLSGVSTSASLIYKRKGLCSYAVQGALSTLSNTKRSFYLKKGRSGSVRFKALLSEYELESLLCAPIISIGKDNEAKVIGMLGVTQPHDLVFLSDDLRILSLLASSAAMGVENAGLYAAERMLRQQEAERAANAERARLARELHDAVTQTLFSASLTAEVLPRIWAKNPEEGLLRLEELRLLTKGALAEMRTLLLELRPKALEESKLEELLKQLSNAASGRARVPVTASLSACGDLAYETKLGFYRIAQEALSNIVKHAEAKQISVSLSDVSDEEGRSEIVMVLRDDGGGFDPQDIQGGHFGVKIMRERAEAIGAAFSIESEKGKGTIIRVTWNKAG